METRKADLDERLGRIASYDIPTFPKPHPKVADELQNACKGRNCFYLIDWLGKIKVLEEQLEIYRKAVSQ